MSTRIAISPRQILNRYGGLVVLLVAIPAVPPLRSAATPPIAQVTIEAGDYYFRAPAQTTEGWITIRLRNRGPSFHHVVLLRISPDASKDSVLARVTTRRGDPDARIVGSLSVGGPEGRMPSGDSYTTVKLDPGTYLLVCTIPLADGAPHATKGMSTELTVLPRTAGGAASRPPAADLDVHLLDYAYTMSRVTLRPGWRTIRVENAGPSEHIAELARLKEGHTAADMLGWAAANFPSATEPKLTISGSTRLSVGQASYIHVNLAPGRYVFFCMLHDGKNRQHVKLGMLREFRVT